ncbi:hypothetical protein AB833_24625 [Chromatiales bacterium (ex Bugula neritina AB1)]|nr:hypothetical protein AB833_24625 [Chromatiales bacterium (ex Bugula neritina AB1)]
MIAETLATRLSHHEREVAYRQYPAAGEPWFKVISGTLPVLVSAPHACMHCRSGQWKMEEEYTAAFAVLLAEATGCSAIYTCAQTQEDPNWLQYGEYKKAIDELALKQKINFVIDLHGMTNRHHMGVAIGTMQGRACSAASVQAVFTVAGFSALPLHELERKTELHWRNLVVDHPRFTGGVRNHTVTRHAVEQLRVPAVQIELASVTRIVFSPSTEDWPIEYTGDNAAILAAFTALCSLIEKEARGA